jgi:hypothetical protein
MIVDLVRNDLGRVAVTGSVTVPELLVVRPAPGLWHLVSTVSARMPVELPTSALLDAAFPPASVTGTPKLRARQLISAGAVSARYCGTVGLRHQRPAANSTSRFAPSNSTPRATRCWGPAAGSPPTPTPMPYGTNACTKPRRSWGSSHR